MTALRAGTPQPGDLPAISRRPRTGPPARRRARRLRLRLTRAAPPRWRSCARGDAGSWNARQHRVTSFDDCVARCVGCARCRFVTCAADEEPCAWYIPLGSVHPLAFPYRYAADEDDCSWYHRCALERLGPDPAFLSVQVRLKG